jgi:hypothetical protein
VLFRSPEEIEALQKNENLGRLKITTEPPSGKTINENGEAVFNELFSYGTRSFSIWTTGGDLVFDSGDEIEQITASEFPDDFNSNNDENGSFDSRSDDKGAEPEAVVIAALEGRTLAFIGLERIGGIMIWDVSNPEAPTFESYTNNRDFSGDAEEGEALDLGIEGMKFISASDSPDGIPLLVTANEVSGTTTIFQIIVKGKPGKGPKALVVDVDRGLTGGALVADTLTEQMLRPAVQEATAQWAAMGVAPDRLGFLNQVHVEIADLSGSVLGLAYSDRIVVDLDAAGYGWSVNSGGVDLLSAVTHEFGHVLGFDHDQGYAVMASTLAPGTQHILASNFGFRSSFHGSANDLATDTRAVDNLFSLRDNSTSSPTLGSLASSLSRNHELRAMPSYNQRFESQFGETHYAWLLDRNLMSGEQDDTDGFTRFWNRPKRHSKDLDSDFDNEDRYFDEEVVDDIVLARVTPEN